MGVSGGAELLYVSFMSVNVWVLVESLIVDLKNKVLSELFFYWLNY